MSSKNVCDFFPSREVNQFSKIQRASTSERHQIAKYLIDAIAV